MSTTADRLAEQIHNLWCLSYRGGVTCDVTSHAAAARESTAELSERYPFFDLKAPDGYLELARGLLANGWLVPVRCGRIDAHDPHDWNGRRCMGPPVTEGGQQCVCGHPVAGCTCEQELADERAREWLE
ncbi:MAG TPA: hypothetical protein VJ782_02220 [Aeromicrobium sp.]|nr:hypothetical protein [Aeromicrobium sp.]